MTRPRLLDLFSGAGGAAMGYHRAGFDITGVDVRPQPRYPFTFHQGDATTWPLDGYDAIHASPPCQDHSELRTAGNHREHGTGWMLPATVDRLRASGLPWVVENVPGADLPGSLVLCGAAFGLAADGWPLRRHRLFASDTWLMGPGCACAAQPVGVYGDHLRLGRAHRYQRGAEVSGPEAVRLASEALGIDWMNLRELCQAIPPAYTEHIGWQLLAQLERVVS